MRTLVIFVFVLMLTVPARAQDKALVELNREIDATEQIVEEQAFAVAEARQLLEEVRSAKDPTLLVVGDMHLRIHDAPFVLYLSTKNHRTVARLESQKREVSEQAVEQAEAFLEEVADRAVARQR